MFYTICVVMEDQINRQTKAKTMPFSVTVGKAQGTKKYKKKEKKKKEQG